VVEVARDWIANLSSHLTAIFSGLLAVTSSGLLTLVLTIVTAYYLLLEGRQLVRFLLRLLPLPPDETAALVSEFREAVVGIVLGIFAIAGYQALVAGLGCLMFGVGKSLVWGALTGVVSLVPVVGTALTCLPLGIMLLATGHVGAGIGFLIYWVVLIAGVADYVLRPWVMQGRMRLHALLVLLSLFGGIEAFGPLGLALGPLFCALFVALLRIYDRDYRPAPRPRTA
jgi:predicted PurR-regulated permease PerM